MPVICKPTCCTHLTRYSAILTALAALDGWVMVQTFQADFITAMGAKAECSQIKSVERGFDFGQCQRRSWRVPKLIAHALSLSCQW